MQSFPNFLPPWHENWFRAHYLMQSIQIFLSSWSYSNFLNVLQANFPTYVDLIRFSWMMRYAFHIVLHFRVGLSVIRESVSNSYKFAKFAKVRKVCIHIKMHCVLVCTSLSKYTETLTKYSCNILSFSGCYWRFTLRKQCSKNISENIYAPQKFVH